MHGQGTYYYANGEKYVGEFRDGKKHGRGAYSWAEKSKNNSDGDIYVGEFNDGKQHGRGTFIWAAWLDRRKSIGGVLRNSKRFKQGGNYIGEWVVGKIHGLGRLT